jgi:hypothetical protein
LHKAKKLEKARPTGYKKWLTTIFTWLHI